MPPRYETYRIVQLVQLIPDAMPALRRSAQADIKGTRGGKVQRTRGAERALRAGLDRETDRGLAKGIDAIGRQAEVINLLRPARFNEVTICPRRDRTCQRVDRHDFRRMRSAGVHRDLAARKAAMERDGFIGAGDGVGRT